MPRGAAKPSPARRDVAVGRSFVAPSPPATVPAVPAPEVHTTPVALAAAAVEPAMPAVEEVARAASPAPTEIPAQTESREPALAPTASNPPTNPLPINMERVMTTAEELISFQQGNFEALVKSGQIWAAGLQDLGRHWAASAQAQMDETMGTVKALTGVKSLREAVELQSTLARASVEKVVAEGGKLTDASLKLAEQTMAPITARLTLAAERFGRTAA